MQDYIKRECGHGRFLPTGEFRTLREGNHYLAVKDNHIIRGGEEEGDWECALTHLNDWPEGPSFVILRCLEDCPHRCDGIGPDENPVCPTCPHRMMRHIDGEGCGEGRCGCTNYGSRGGPAE